MARRLSIAVTIWFDGIHYWKDAPDKVSFLRYPHRHSFKVVAERGVVHLDRDTEFFILANDVRTEVLALGERDETDALLLGGLSCEMIADYLIDRCNLTACSVWEDGRHAAHIEVI